MLSYCLKCRKNAKTKNPKVVKTKNGRIMLLSGNKDIFKWNSFIRSSFILIQGIKVNGIVNKFLLAGDKFIPEMYLRQPGFMHSACGPFTKNKERIQKF